MYSRSLTFTKVTIARKIFPSTSSWSMINKYKRRANVEKTYNFVYCFLLHSPFQVLRTAQVAIIMNTGWEKIKFHFWNSHTRENLTMQEILFFSFFLCVRAKMVVMVLGVTSGDRGNWGFVKKALERLMRKMSSFSGTSWSTSSIVWKRWFLWNKKNLWRTGNLYIKIDAEEARRIQHNLINMSASTWQEARNAHARRA